jgi:hypothetical protein
VGAGVGDCATGVDVSVEMGVELGDSVTGVGGAVGLGDCATGDGETVGLGDCATGERVVVRFLFGQKKTTRATITATASNAHSQRVIAGPSLIFDVSGPLDFAQN